MAFATKHLSIRQLSLFNGKKKQNKEINFELIFYLKLHCMNPRSHPLLIF